GDDRAAPEASRSLASSGHELLPSPAGGAASGRQGGPGGRAPRRGASRDPPPLGPAPVGDAGGRGLRRRRDGPQPGALDRERRPAKHRAGRGLPRRGGRPRSFGSASPPPVLI